MDENILEILDRAPLLKPLTQSQLEEIASDPDAEIVEYPEGECVYDEDDESDAFYVIGLGEVEVVGDLDEDDEDDRRRHRLNLLYPGEFFGDLGLRFNKPRTVQVRAVEDTVLLKIGPTLFKELVRKYAWFENRLDRLGKEIERRSLLEFPGQREDEVVLVYTRQHWVGLLVAMVRNGLIMGLTLIAGVVCVAAPVLVASGRLGVGGGTLGDLFTASTIVLMFLLFIFFLTWIGVIAWQVIDWLNDYLIVTNERIIRIDKVVLFQNRRDEVPLNKVQNVNVTELNPISQFFGYGTLQIDTAAQGAEGLVPPFQFMPKPDAARQRIIFELNRENAKFVQESRDARKQNLLAALGRAPAPADGEARVPTEVTPPPPPEAPSRFGFIDPIFGYFFPKSQEIIDDTIIWRKSRWRLTLNSIGPWFIFIISAILFILMQSRMPEVVRPGFVPIITAWNRWVILIAVLYFGALIFWLWWIYEDWRNEMYILRPDVILEQREKPFGLDKMVRSASLDTIQNVTYNQHNPLMVLLDIGNVSIHTAGKEGQLYFRYVRDPRSVQSYIARYIEQRQRQRAAEEAGQVRQELMELLRIYDETVREERRNAPTEPPPPPREERPVAGPPAPPDATTRRWPFD